MNPEPMDEETLPTKFKIDRAKAKLGRPILIEC